MSIGPSGRIVIEIPPELKRDLHASLLKEGLTLKDWFIAQANMYVEERQQLPLRFDSSPDGKVAHRVSR